jgi:oligoribonuclease
MCEIYAFETVYLVVILYTERHAQWSMKAIVESFRRMDSFMKNDDNLIWVDLEMTGLEPDSDVVIEIATIVTDSQLNTLAEGPVLAIHQSQATMDAMDEWNTTHHGRSGLTQRVLDSDVTSEQASLETIEFLKQWIPAGKSPMCGNSICQDRRFMARHMPILEEYFHYRNLDVSTLKELARRWKPKALEGFKKTGAHLALDDIRESIAELQHYREHFIQL